MESNFKLNSGMKRAIITFVISGGLLWGIFYFLLEQLGVAPFAQGVMIFIGAGWAAMWVYKKTEGSGYY